MVREHRSGKSAVLACVSLALSIWIGMHAAVARSGEAAPDASATRFASWFNLETRDPSLPRETGEGGFTTSDTCRACHPGPYESWHDSFHRTMTQPAGPDAIVGDFEDVTLEARGHVTKLAREGDIYWVELTDPVWFMDPDPNKQRPPPRLRRPVVMTTGSHHLQYYWIRRPESGEYHVRPDHGALMSVPWVWMIEEQRWLPVQDSFLTPPTREHEVPLVWNTSCFSCHSVATQPRYSANEDEFETHSVELGIACEACHGPAEEHIEAHRSPLSRYARYFAAQDAADETIVNPARLSPPRSRDVCGQCHSFGEPRDMASHQVKGVAFRPGQDLHASQDIYRLRPTPEVERPQHDGPATVNFGGNFWADGTIRVAGREYNGLMETGCATRGELTCLTCHSLHDYREPGDQLNAEGDRDATCLGCHPAVAQDVQAHTRHDPASSGSRCMNCHMPHTTYGLFVAMRSHRIDSPSAANHATTGRPNACNLCHLDQTLEWTNQKLHAWYGQPKLELPREHREIAAGVLLATKGDAAQRAIVAWHFGWPEARSASGEKWMGAYLALLLRDPYVAIRRVAERSITSLPGFEHFDYEFAASPAALEPRQLEAVALWRALVANGSDRSGSHLLMDAHGKIDEPALGRLLKQRDHTPIRISE